MGNAVKRNQLLAVIDSTELTNKCSKQGRPTITPASLTRNKKLYEKKLIAKQDLDNAEALMKVAQAISRPRKNAAELCPHNAPFAGVITKPVPR